jgi:hypothetical protein
MSRLVILATMSLAACRPVAAPSATASGSPILESSEWTAWIDAMPGPNNQPRLMISGKVRVSTGGYRAHFTDMRVAESYPVQIFLDLAVTPPSGPATQALTTIDVRGEWPVAPPVGAITIRCGGQMIGRIDEIVTAL